MTFVFSELAGALKAGGSITVDNVLEARRSVWADGAISLPEAEAIFELNQLCDGPAPEWVDFVVEALTEFTVNQHPPIGYVGKPTPPGQWRRSIATAASIQWRNFRCS